METHVKSLGVEVSSGFECLKVYLYMCVMSILMLCPNVEQKYISQPLVMWFCCGTFVYTFCCHDADFQTIVVVLEPRNAWISSDVQQSRKPDQNCPAPQKGIFPKSAKLTQGSQTLILVIEKFYKRLHEFIYACCTLIKVSDCFPYNLFP